MDRNLLRICAVPRRMISYSSLMLLAPGIFPKFWSIASLISPSAPTITGTVSVPIPHVLVVSISRSLYFESFSMTFVEVFQSDGTDTSISLQHLLAWSLFTISGLFSDSSLSVCNCISQRIVTSSFSVTVSGLYSYHLSGTSMSPSQSLQIRLGREALVLGCNYQSLCLSFQSSTSEALVGFIIVNICFPYSQLGYLQSLVHFFNQSIVIAF